MHLNNQTNTEPLEQSSSMDIFKTSNLYRNILLCNMIIILLYIFITVYSFIDNGKIDEKKKKEVQEKLFSSYLLRILSLICSICLILWIVLPKEIQKKSNN